MRMWTLRFEKYHGAQVLPKGKYDKIHEPTNDIDVIALKDVQELFDKVKVLDDKLNEYDFDTMSQLIEVRRLIKEFVWLTV